MSPAGAYTDFHVDFGGSSVWYHLLSGSKTFLVFPPTLHNTAAFESWAGSDTQVTLKGDL
jgi:F-box/leucine-rich repeat protein 10/11